MVEKTEIEFFIAMNEDGDFELATEASDARELLSENCGGTACRIVKITAKIAAPVIEEVEIDVPDAAGVISEVDVA
jgi:hypothetical protein